MGFDDDGDPPAGQTEEADDTGDVRMGFEETTEEFVRNMEKNYGNTSLQKEAERSAHTSTSGTSTTATTTATGMKKIEEEDEEEEVELGMKTRNWRKINLSFAIELGELGDDGDDIRASDKKVETTTTR
jgi:hypothetical protein